MADAKRPVARRTEVLGALVDAGAELILGGHIHQAAVSERREFEVLAGDARAAVVSIAPGLGQPRPRRRGEARGLHVYEISARESRGQRTSGGGRLGLTARGASRAAPRRSRSPGGSRRAAGPVSGRCCTKRRCR